MYYVLYNLEDGSVVAVQDTEDFGGLYDETRGIITITEEFFASCNYDQSYIEVRDGQAYRSFECDKNNKRQEMYNILGNKTIKIAEDKYYDANRYGDLPLILALFELTANNFKMPYYEYGMYAGYVTINEQLNAIGLVRNVMKICALVNQFENEKTLAINNATTIEELNAITFTDYPVMDATI